MSVCMPVTVLSRSFIEFAAILVKLTRSPAPVTRTPAAFVVAPAAAFMRPAARTPCSAIIRRTCPVPWSPYVAMTCGRPVTLYPHITHLGHRRSNLITDGWRWCTDIDRNLSNSWCRKCGQTKYTAKEPFRVHDSPLFCPGRQRRRICLRGRYSGAAVREEFPGNHPNFPFPAPQSADSRLHWNMLQESDQSRLCDKRKKARKGACSP